MPSDTYILTLFEFMIKKCDLENTFVVALCTSRRVKSCEVMKFFNFLGSKRIPQLSLCQYYQSNVFSWAVIMHHYIRVHARVFEVWVLLELRTLQKINSSSRYAVYVCAFPLDELSHFLLQFVNSLFCLNIHSQINELTLSLFFYVKK